MSCTADFKVWLKEAQLTHCEPYRCTLSSERCAQKYVEATPDVACFSCNTGAMNAGGRRKESPALLATLTALEALECATATQVLRHLKATGRLTEGISHPMQIYRLLKALVARGQVEYIDRAFRRLGSELDRPRPGLLAHSGDSRKRKILEWLERTGGAATVAHAATFVDSTRREVREAFRQLERAGQVARVDGAEACAWRACTGNEVTEPTVDAPVVFVQMGLF